MDRQKTNAALAAHRFNVVAVDAKTDTIVHRLPLCRVQRDDKGLLILKVEVGEPREFRQSPDNSRYWHEISIDPVTGARTYSSPTEYLMLSINLGAHWN